MQSRWPTLSSAGPSSAWRPVKLPTSRGRPRVAAAANAPGATPCLAVSTLAAGALPRAAATNRSRTGPARPSAPASRTAVSRRTRTRTGLAQIRLLSRSWIFACYGSLTCRFVLVRREICALAGGLDTWCRRGYPRSADGQDFAGRQGRADPALVLPRCTMGIEQPMCSRAAHVLWLRCRLVTVPGRAAG